MEFVSGELRFEIVDPTCGSFAEFFEALSKTGQVDAGHDNEPTSIEWNNQSNILIVKF